MDSLGVVELAGAVLVHVETVGEVLVRDGDVKVVAAKHVDSDVQRRLVDSHRRADEVDVEQVEPVVEQRVGKLLVLRAKVFPDAMNRNSCVS